jgi:hypothetical protein
MRDRFIDCFSKASLSVPAQLAVSEPLAVSLDRTGGEAIDTFLMIEGAAYVGGSSEATRGFGAQDAQTRPRRRERKEKAEHSDPDKPRNSKSELDIRYCSLCSSVELRRVLPFVL